MVVEDRIDKNLHNRVGASFGQLFGSLASLSGIWSWLTQTLGVMSRLLIATRMSRRLDRILVVSLGV